MDLGIAAGMGDDDSAVATFGLDQPSGMMVSKGVGEHLLDARAQRLIRRGRLPGCATLLAIHAVGASTSGIEGCVTRATSVV
jgi:hypothetical protein